MADGDSAQSGAEGTQSGTGENTTESQTQKSAAGTQSGAQEGAKSARETELEAALAQQREHKRMADQRAADFEAKLKQLTEKDMPEAEKLKREHAEYQQQVETLQKTNRDLALKVAFLSDNTHTWHDPSTALKLVDLDKVEIDGNGQVTGLKDALKALATSHPFLIKAEVKQEEKQTPPGTAPGNNGTSGANKPNGAKLESRFPVMRTRVQR